MIAPVTAILIVTLDVSLSFTRTLVEPFDFAVIVSVESLNEAVANVVSGWVMIEYGFTPPRIVTVAIVPAFVVTDDGVAVNVPGGVVVGGFVVVSSLHPFTKSAASAMRQHKNVMSFDGLIDLLLGKWWVLFVGFWPCGSAQDKRTKGNSQTLNLK